MAADAYVTKCLKAKLKTELMDLGEILDVPLRKSWTKGRMVGSLCKKYVEDPGILFSALSRESAEFLRKCLRNPVRQGKMAHSVHGELEFLGLVERRKRNTGKRADLVEKRGVPVDDSWVSFFEAPAVKRIMLDRRQGRFIQRLEGMEKVLRGMLRGFGLLEEGEAVRMAAIACLEGLGPDEKDEDGSLEAMEGAVRTLLRCRLGLRSDIGRYQEEGMAYLHHPSVIDPQRLRYSIEASPVESCREFTFGELVGLGDGEETAGAAYLGLLSLLAERRRKAESRVEATPREVDLETDSQKPGRQEWKGLEADILHIKLRLREGAPNLEIVREVMEWLSFEDHQEVSRFIERFISHCDDIPRWTLKGYRMNEI